MGIELGNVLREARKRRGLSQQEVGAAVGVTRTAVGLWEKGETEPTMQNLVDACRQLGIDLGAAVAGRLEPEAPAAASAAADHRRADDEMVQLAEDDPDIFALPRDVPVYGVAVGGEDADFYSNGEVIDVVRRPAGIERARNVYAIYVVGSSMWPRFEEGELVYVSERRPAAIGDYVVVELRPPTGERTGRGFLKRLVRRTPSRIICEQFNPPKTLEFAAEEIKAVHRVIPWNELLGR